MLRQDGGGPGGDEWSVSLEATPEWISPGATTELWVTIEDDQEQPCPDGTLVTFSLEAGAALGALGATTATTTGGRAMTTFTAGQQTGSVSVRASALDEHDSTTILINESVPAAWRVLVTPTPDVGELPADGQSQISLELRVVDLFTSDPYPDEVTFELSAAFGGYVTIHPTTVTSSGGVAHSTLTAGTNTTPGFPEIITVEVPGHPEIAAHGLMLRLIEP